MTAEGEKEPDLSEEGRNAAREFFTTIFNTDWTGREGRKKLREIIPDVVRMRRTYPDEYGEVLESFGLDVEEWRRFKNLMSKPDR